MIKENAIMSTDFECFHMIQQCKKPDDNCSAYKLDLTKAYDKLGFFPLTEEATILFVVDGLTCILSRVRMKILYPGDPGISHFLFVDTSLIYFKALCSKHIQYMHRWICTRSTQVTSIASAIILSSTVKIAQIRHN
jgi:hypothetical protein